MDGVLVRVSVLLAYIAVVVTLVALGVRRATHRLTLLTQPRLAITSFIPLVG